MRHFDTESEGEDGARVAECATWIMLMLSDVIRFHCLTAWLQPFLEPANMNRMNALRHRIRARRVHFEVLEVLRSKAKERKSVSDYEIKRHLAFGAAGWIEIVCADKRVQSFGERIIFRVIYFFLLPVLLISSTLHDMLPYWLSCVSLYSFSGRSFSIFLFLFVEKSNKTFACSTSRISCYLIMKQQKPEWSKNCSLLCRH